LNCSIPFGFGALLRGNVFFFLCSALLFAASGSSAVLCSVLTQPLIAAHHTPSVILEAFRVWDLAPSLNATETILEMSRAH
jgi:hypothetical protein